LLDLTDNARAVTPFSEPSEEAVFVQHITEHPRPVTLSDVARAAGVSVSSVSRILAGKARVSRATEARVLQTAQALGYRPNLHAQGLARGRTGVIGVLSQHRASSYYGRILEGVELALMDTPYHPVFASAHWNVDHERSALDLLLRYRVDGIVVLGGLLDDAQLAAIDEHTPLLVVGRSFAADPERSLAVDNVDPAEKLTRYLVELGHRRIAHIAGPPFTPESAARRAGYERALREAGIEPDPQLVVGGDFLFESGSLAIDELLARGAAFTAVFAGNDWMAYGARSALDRHGLRVPDDVSLVGFDDDPVAEWQTPPLTTVRQPTVDLGSVAAEAMMRVLAGEEPALPVFEPELVIRGSAAAPPAG
jgi:LacI family transcriptional regulator